MSVHADIVKNFGNTVSYNSVDLTKEKIDVDASIFNDPIAQAAAGVVLKPVDSSNLLSSQDSAFREIKASLAVQELIDASGNPIEKSE